MIGIFLAVATAQGFDPASIETAVSAELGRAMKSLKLEDQPLPKHITVRLGAGEFSEVGTIDGALSYENSGPYRELRADIRVGDARMDSGNFSSAVGTRDGTAWRGLAHEDKVGAIRRELWLAMDSAYKGATEVLAAKQAAREGRAQAYTPDYSLAPVVELGPRPMGSTNPPGLKQVVLALGGAVSEDRHLEFSAVLGGANIGQVLVHNSEGTMAWIPEQRLVIRASVQSVATDGASLKNGRSWVVKDLDHLPPIATMQQSLQAASAWLDILKETEVGAAYLGPVLFEQPAAAELFRQLLHPQISGTPPLELAPESAASDSRPVPVARLGRRLLPVGWSVLDDPTADSSLASFGLHDDDAVATQAVKVVEDGVCQDVLMSRVPRFERQASTGHGRGFGSGRVEAMPRQVTIRGARPLGEKKLRKKALAYAASAGLDHVLVVRRILTISEVGDFEFAFTGDGPLSGLTAPAEVYKLYSDGRKVPVRGLQFVGVDRRMLRDIVASGPTGPAVQMLDIPGNSSRFVLERFDGFPVSWAVPPVLISEVELTSRSGGEMRVLSPPALHR